MSAYITYQKPFLNEDALINALVACGFERRDIEVHANAVQLVGYTYTSETAHIVIRKGANGTVYGDTGFKRTETGYRMIVDDYNIDKFQNLEQQYSKELAYVDKQKLKRQQQVLVDTQRKLIRKRAKKLGYNVKETAIDGKIRLSLVKRVY